MVFDKVKEIINDTLSCGEDIITMDAVHNNLYFFYE